MRRLSRTTVLLALACALGVQVASAGNAVGESGDAPNVRALVFDPSAHPYGADMTTWGERAVRWIYGQPYEQNPAFDQTGEDCAVAQQGPVWFIPPIFAPPGTPRPIRQDASRTCTVPAHTAILLDVGAVTVPFPCPDESFRPAPGQSLYEFLSDLARLIMNTVNRLDVTIDGQGVPDVLGYRFASADLFDLTGDVTLQTRLDDCITGSPQPAVMDGFFLMIKPLEVGTHTIVVRGTNTAGDDRRFTYHLTIH